MKNIRFLSIAISLLIFVVACSDDKNHAIDSYFGFDIPKDSLDNYLELKMRELTIPGLSLALINNGQVVYHRTKGFANKEKELPATDTTIFEAASMSKSVFGFFVMNYVEEGKLDLDKPLYEYLPYPDIADDDRYKKITARIVLSHRSGFPNWRENEPDKKLKLKFEPGSDYLYSGEGYQYLAMILRQIENTDWAGLEAAFQDKIGKPLGLEHTVFIQTPYTRKHKAEPYDENGKWIDWENDYWYRKGDGVFGAAYSIHSESIDFSKWMIGIMEEEILSKASYAELLKPHSEIPSDDVTLHYTLGLMKYPFPFTDIYGHGGNNEGFTSFFTLSTGKEWGFVLFTNSEYGEQLGQDLFFYLLLGPNQTQIFIFVGVILLSFIIALVFVTKYLVTKLKGQS